MTTTYKKACDLQTGDVLVSTTPGHAVFFDRVSEVRFVRDGQVHIDLNCWTATRVIPDTEKVRVLVTSELKNS